MEVTLSNAFLIISMLTWRLCTSSLESLTLNFQSTIQSVMLFALSQPFTTTLILLSVIGFVLIFVSITLIILVGVSGILATIIIFEGFAYLSVSILLCLITYLILIVITLLYGIQSLIDINEGKIMTH